MAALAVRLTYLPGVLDGVDLFALKGAAAVNLDPLLEISPLPPECVLWNLHRRASEALRVGDTNRFQILQAMYWRLMAVSKARNTTTTK